jgi:excisionase family DNA binding protein
VRKPGSALLPLERPLFPSARVRSDQPIVQSPRADPLLDIPAVAARLGVSSKTVRRHIDRGDLAVHHIGRLLRVSEEDLASFVAERRRFNRKIMCNDGEQCA